MIRVTISLLIMMVSFLLIIPPVQSAPEPRISFYPMSLASTGLFVMSAFVVPRYEENSNLCFGLILLKGSSFFVFAWLLFERVSVGVI